MRRWRVGAGQRHARTAGLTTAHTLGLVFTLLVLVGLAAAGCGKSSRSSTTAPTGTSAKLRRVLAFGDSVTLGITTSGGRTFIVSRPYPTILGDLLRTLNPESSTLNAGAGGEVTMLGASRFPGALAGSGGANVVLILEGVNDVRALFPADFIVANLRSMVRTAKASGVTALIGTLPPERLSPNNPVGPHIEAVNDSIRAMAAQEGIGVVDFFRGMTVADVSDDGFHPSQDGYNVMANLAFQVIAALP